jgi:exodeoxyribonuclease-3
LNVAYTEDDLANPKQNEGEHGYTKEERKNLGEVIKKGFVDTFRIFTQGNGHYTWWVQWRNARERNVGWRIDYIFVSSSIKERVKEAKICKEVMGSDHCPVLVDLA